MVNFYDGTKLLNTKDKNGQRPEILFSISNRGAGKTYFFARYLIENYEKTGRKFALLCRYATKELGAVADGIFKAFLANERKGYSVSEKVLQRGVYSEVVMTHLDQDKKTVTDKIGYVLPINSSDALKRISSTFVDVDVMFFDEFQCDNYVPDEVNKFINIHFTVARGNKEGVRFVPVILASNSLSITNPYFTALGIATKIQSNTHFFKGDGFVLERFTNTDVARKQRESTFNKAFAGSRQVVSNIDNSWLNDSWSLVGKPDGWGRALYVCTMIDGDKKYGVRYYPQMGYYYINRKIDSSCSAVFNLSVDGVENVPLIKSTIVLRNLKNGYGKGIVRFSDIAVKDVMSLIVI